MIKDNQKYFNRLQVLLDAAIVAISYILAWFIKFRILDSTGGALSMGQYFRMLYLVVPGYLILYSMFHLYTSKRDTKSKYEISSIVMANAVGIGCFMIVQYMLKQMHFSREMLLIFAIGNTLFMVLS